MNILLVCQNSKCRFLFDAGKKQNGLSSDLPIKHCPECGSAWSTRCPYCKSSLEVTLRSGRPPVCCSCGQTMKPEIEHVYGTRRETGESLLKQQLASD